jgi:hypothetical protein
MTYFNVHFLFEFGDVLNFEFDIYCYFQEIVLAMICFLYF